MKGRPSDRNKSGPQEKIELQQLIGDPAALARDLQAFQKSANEFSGNGNDLIRKHRKKWIAVYEGKIEAEAPTLNTLLTQIDAKGIPRGSTMVRYIDRNNRVLIL